MHQVKGGGVVETGGIVEGGGVESGGVKGAAARAAAARAALRGRHQRLFEASGGRWRRGCRLGKTVAVETAMVMETVDRWWDRRMDRRQQA